MPRPSPFPKDERGSYVTVSLLLQMKNGDAVQIFRLETDEMIFLPDSTEDGEISSSSVSEKVYFKDVKSVSVDYFLKSDGQPRTIFLRNLKEVRSV